MRAGRIVKWQRNKKQAESAQKLRLRIKCQIANPSSTHQSQAQNLKARALYMYTREWSGVCLHVVVVVAAVRRLIDHVRRIIVLLLVCGLRLQFVLGEFDRVLPVGSLVVGSGSLVDILKLKRAAIAIDKPKIHDVSAISELWVLVRFFNIHILLPVFRLLCPVWLLLRMRMVMVMRVMRMAADALHHHLLHHLLHALRAERTAAAAAAADRAVVMMNAELNRAAQRTADVKRVHGSHHGSHHHVGVRLRLMRLRLIRLRLRLWLLLAWSVLLARSVVVVRHAAAHRTEKAKQGAKQRARQAMARTRARASTCTCTRGTCARGGCCRSRSRGCCGVLGAVATTTTVSVSVSSAANAQEIVDTARHDIRHQTGNHLHGIEQQPIGHAIPLQRNAAAHAHLVTQLGRPRERRLVLARHARQPPQRRTRGRDLLDQRRREGRRVRHVAAVPAVRDIESLQCRAACARMVEWGNYRRDEEMN